MHIVWSSLIISGSIILVAVVFLVLLIVLMVRMMRNRNSGR
ncbi:hypothetical protein [Paenibacillus shenyangensis]|nr:hypothetical protein [Paenibacillus sp. A9]